MEIKSLYSISEIKPDDCYQTNGSRPVRVLCSDLEDYVCKYYNGQGAATSLFNELIAASFLNIWEMSIPEYSFVKIKEEHIIQTGYPKHYFNSNCYGSKFLQKSKEVDKFFIENPAIKKDHYCQLLTILKIGLFDIWLCNEDRHFGNMNMLYDFEQEQFIPIDHCQCFNGNNLDKEPYLISENESILDSPLLIRIISRNLHKEFIPVCNHVKESFHIDVQACKNQIDTVLSCVSADWQIDIPFVKSRLESFFSPEWISDCLGHFEKIIQLNLNRK